MTEHNPYIGDLDQVEWDPIKETFVPTREAADEIAQEFPEFSETGRGLDREQFDRLVGPDGFASSLAKATRWFAKTKGVESIALDENDPAFVEASEVVYRRIMDGPGRFLLPYLSNADLVDLWIISAFAIPYFAGIRKEVTAKRKAARATAARADHATDSNAGDGASNAGGPGHE